MQLDQEKYITEYKAFAPPYNGQSNIVDNIVKCYRQIAAGKQGVTFATIKSAYPIAAKFNDAGIQAEVISPKTPDKCYLDIIDDFRDKKITQIITIISLNQVFYLPASEVIIMTQPTRSYSLFSRQLNYALRAMPGKDCALIIDFVNNITRHGFPDPVILTQKIEETLHDATRQLGCSMGYSPRGYDRTKNNIQCGFNGRYKIGCNKRS